VPQNFSFCVSQTNKVPQITAIEQVSFSFRRDALTYITSLQYHRESSFHHTIQHTHTHTHTS